jgi:hypothetical protein
MAGLIKYVYHILYHMPEEVTSLYQVHIVATESGAYMVWLSRTFGGDRVLNISLGNHGLGIYLPLRDWVARRLEEVGFCLVTVSCN